VFGSSEKVPTGDCDIIQSPKRRVFKKSGRWMLFRIVKVMLIHQTHKPTDSISLLGS
jgi:hypothetical protein